MESLDLFSFGQPTIQTASTPCQAFTKPPAGMQLRQYQQEAIEAVERGWTAFDRQLIVMPTGSGKTIVMANLAQRSLPGKTLILAHQNELIEQAVDKLFQATGIVADVEKAERRASLRSDVVVASIQSMVRRLDKFPHDHFARVICDESHLSLSDQWQIVLKHFISAKILGVTATPDRSDGKALMAFYQNLAYEVKLFDLIKLGFLSRISVRTIPLEIDLRGVGQTKGDYDVNQLDETLAPYFDKVCDAMKEFAHDRKILVFLPLIKSSISFVNACHRHGIGARHIDGASDDRRECIQAFKDDGFQVLANSQLLTTGYDEPTIDCVINLRPTRSRTLYSQSIGRGTRIKPAGRPHADLLILDFLWQFEKHVIMGPANLIAKDDDQARRIKKRYDKKNEEMDLEYVDSEAAKERELDLINALKNQKRKGEYFDAMAWAAMSGDRELIEYEPMTSNEARPMTKGQEEYLHKKGFILETIKGQGHAAVIVNHLQERDSKNLCSYKQLHFLRKHNVADAEKLTKYEATKILSQIWGK